MMKTEFALLETRLNAVMGVAIAAVGSGQDPIELGDWPSALSPSPTTTSPAWSTIKVPLAIAALREQHHVTDDMAAAITQSDNAAAESIWASLGDPITAAHKVEGVLRDYGDRTTVVEWRKVRREFTAFGQSNWSLDNQVRFTSNALCDRENAPIFALMGRIEQGQAWGIGVIPGSRFKGGWGPSLSGSYLVRQIGVLSAPAGMVTVALAAQPASGSFEDGTKDLTEVAEWLTGQLESLPAGQCGR